jgi:hypothetical protein
MDWHAVQVLPMLYFAVGRLRSDLLASGHQAA